MQLTSNICYIAIAPITQLSTAIAHRSLFFRNGDAPRSRQKDSKICCQIVQVHSRRLAKIEIDQVVRDLAFWESKDTWLMALQVNGPGTHLQGQL